MTTSILYSPASYVSAPTYASSNSIGWVNNNYRRVVEQITIGSSAITINQIEFFAKTDNPLNTSVNFFVKIYPGNFNAVYGYADHIADVAAIASSSKKVGTLGSATGNEFNRQNYTFSSPVTLSANTTYCIEFSADGIVGSNGIQMPFLTVSGFPQMAFSTAWSDYSGFAVVFSLINEVTNTAPTDISLTYASGSGVSESAAVGSVVGTLSATDAEGVQGMAYSLVAGTGDTDNAKFTIVGSSLKTAVALGPISANQSLSIRVRATDNGGMYFDKVLSVAVLNDTANDPVSASAGIAINGKSVVDAAVDPRDVEVTINASALPVGSVVRNSSTKQKFMKITGGTKAFQAIELAPKVAWGWSSGGEQAWAILKDL